MGWEKVNSLATWKKLWVACVHTPVSMCVCLFDDLHFSSDVDVCVCVVCVCNFQSFFAFCFLVLFFLFSSVNHSTALMSKGTRMGNKDQVTFTIHSITRQQELSLKAYFYKVFSLFFLKSSVFQSMLHGVLSGFPRAKGSVGTKWAELWAPTPGFNQSHYAFIFFLNNNWIPKEQFPWKSVHHIKIRRKKKVKKITP